MLLLPLVASLAAAGASPEPGRGDLDFARVRGALAKQVRLIKSRYKCDSVRFRIQVEGGRARLKAVPLRHVRSASSTGG